MPMWHKTNSLSIDRLIFIPFELLSKDMTSFDEIDKRVNNLCNYCVF